MGRLNFGHPVIYRGLCVICLPIGLCEKLG